MLFSKLLKIVTFSAGIFLSVSASAAVNIANSAEVYLNSDPGSWVGGGIGAPNVTWKHGIDGIFSGGPNYESFDRGVQISYNDGNYWTFQFAAPSYDPTTNTNIGQSLEVGLYTNAQRFPFNSPTKPGINISGNGRGNNAQTGWFDVLEIEYDATGNLSKFAVDFKQFDESSTTSGLYGSLRFNSSIAINTVPEPSTFAIMVIGLVGMVAAVRRQTLKSTTADNAEQQI
jgi:hypothetical protein